VRTPYRALLLRLVLFGFLTLALVYLAQVGWSLRHPPTPTPLPTRPLTLTSTPFPSPPSTPLVLPTPTAVFTWTPTPTRPMFSGERAYQHVLMQVSLGPRVPNSPSSRLARAYMRGVLERSQWAVQEEEFLYHGTALVNLVAKQGQGPIVILGAHYDSRPRADRDPVPAHRLTPVPGANDGASGVAVLLELSRVLRWNADAFQVWLYFFDGEDSGDIQGWDWAVGARHAAQALSPNEVQAMILVDMVGDCEQQFYWEGHSDSKLRAAIWEVARTLGFGDVFIPQERLSVMDDHVPFVERGIPAVDIIDFDYPYWHTVADTADKVCPQSLERVGRVLQEWIYRRFSAPSSPNRRS